MPARAQDLPGLKLLRRNPAALGIPPPSSSYAQGLAVLLPRDPVRYASSSSTRDLAATRNLREE